MKNMIGAILAIVAGILNAALNAFKPRFYWEHRRARFFRNLIGDKPTTILYYVLSFVLIGTGVLLLSDPDGKLELAEISEIYEQGLVDSTVARLRDFTVKHPNNAEAWVVLGDALEDLEQDSDAEESYNRALAINAEMAEAYSGIGILKSNAGELDTAAIFYKKALEFKPNHSYTHSSLAVLELKRYKDSEALQHAERAYELNNQDAVIAANLSIVYHYNNMLEKRDQTLVTAKKLGYSRPDKLLEIFADKLTVRDERYQPAAE